MELLAGLLFAIIIILCLIIIFLHFDMRVKRLGNYVLESEVETRDNVEKTMKRVNILHKYLIDLQEGNTTKVPKDFII